MSENPHAGQGSVLLDIGGDVGALVVQIPTGAEGIAVGMEVEIRPAGRVSTGHLPHVAVVERPVAGGTVPSLVFAELTAGRYQLVHKGTDETRLTVQVVGGEVTVTDWPVDQHC